MLLFDNNCSPRLVDRLADLAPASTHVATVGLAAADDRTVWAYAQTHQLLIVTKDTDFNDLSVLLGAPPKVLWLRIGNCTTAAMEALIRTHWEAIAAFIQDPTVDLMTIIPFPTA